MIDSILLSGLCENAIEYKLDYGLKNACTFGMGGSCRLALFPDSTDQLVKCIELVDSMDEELFVIGKGSNTLFGDGFIDKVIIFTSRVHDIDIRDCVVNVSAGVPLMPLCSILADNCLGGMEFACGIPGSIGGALFMNAGAYGGCMADVVTKSLAYDRNSESTVILIEHGFDYRKSIYSQNRQLICLSAELMLCKRPSDEIKSKMKELLIGRRQKQPLEYPSAGSYFKRPQDDYAGRLIEVCGLKGMSVGGAQISEKHAGFIINRGGATLDDVLRLEAKVTECVFNNTGIMLEREPEIIT